VKGFEGVLPKWSLAVAANPAATKQEVLDSVQSGMRRFAEPVDDEESKLQPSERAAPPAQLPAEPPLPDPEAASHPSWSTALEEAKDRRVLECLHVEYDLQQAFADWCAQENLPEVVVTGPYRDRREPDRLLFLVSLDLSRTNYRLNQQGLDAATAPVGNVRCWPASELPDGIPDSRFRKISLTGYLTHDPAVELAEKWLGIALDPEYSDVEPQGGEEPEGRAQAGQDGPI
jgi:hypothetical protein